MSKLNANSRRVRHNTCLKSEVGAKHMSCRYVDFSQAGPEVGGINAMTRGIKSNVKQKSVIRFVCESRKYIMSYRRVLFYVFCFLHIFLIWHSSSMKQLQPAEAPHSRYLSHHGKMCKMQM